MGNSTNNPLQWQRLVKEKKKKINYKWTFPMDISGDMSQSIFYWQVVV